MVKWENQEGRSSVLYGNQLEALHVSSGEVGESRCVLDGALATKSSPGIGGGEGESRGQVNVLLGKYRVCTYDIACQCGGEGEARGQVKCLSWEVSRCVRMIIL